MASIKQRTCDLFSVLDSANGGAILIATILDLENEVNDLKKQVTPERIILKRPGQRIEIKRLCDNDGNLDIDQTTRPAFIEQGWIQSLAEQTDLDIRAILSPLPTELGMYEVTVAYKPASDKMSLGILRFWVVK